MSAPTKDSRCFGTSAVRPRAITPGFARKHPAQRSNSW